MGKNVNETEKQVGTATDEAATVNTQVGTATEDEPKKEGIFKKAKKKADGILDKDLGTPREILKKLGKVTLIVGSVAGAFILGKKVQEAQDNSFLEADFVDGEEPVAELPDDVVEEVEVEEPVYEEYVEE